MKRILLIMLTLALTLSSLFMLALPASASPPLEVEFVSVGASQQIYCRYYGGNITAGILKMEIQPSGPILDSYCIDLYKRISLGDILIANGGLSEATSLGTVNWCAVNYILLNYNYQTTYTSPHPLAGLTENQRAATIQAAIWHFTTEPYGLYPGTDGKYQYMTDPAIPHCDAEQVRSQALALVNIAKTSCIDGFKYPTDIDLQDDINNACTNNPQLMTATVYDQDNNPIGAGINVVFETTTGGHFYEYDSGNPTTPGSELTAPWIGSTDANGQVKVFFAADVGTTQTVTVWVSGKYGTLLYNPTKNIQTLTTLSLLPHSITDNSSRSCITEVSIDIEKSTNGEDADAAPGPYITVGNPVTWTYTVTNTGNVPLNNVTVTDSETGVTPAYVSGDVNGNNELDITETWIFEANGTAVAGQYANIGEAVGTVPDGSKVSDTDPSHYFGKEAAIDIEKSTNGEDADNPTGPIITVGNPVNWTYVVKNTGNVTLTNITVTDNQGVTVTCPKTTLAPGESMTCTASGIAVAGQYANIGEAVGTAPDGATVSDTDPSHYFGSDNGGPHEEPEVGGDIYPTSKLVILTPWIILAVVIVVGTTILIRRRQNQS